MKTQFTKVFAIAFIAGTIAFNFSHYNTRSYTDIILANTDALANDEGGGTGSYDVDEATTDHKMNDVIYKQSKVVNCYPGGNRACSAGNFYRLKKDDGSWDKWTPA